MSFIGEELKYGDAYISLYLYISRMDVCFAMMAIYFIVLHK